MGGGCAKGRWVGKCVCLCRVVGGGGGSWAGGGGADGGEDAAAFLGGIYPVDRGINPITKHISIAINTCGLWNNVLGHQLPPHRFQELVTKVPFDIC